MNDVTAAACWLDDDDGDSNVDIGVAVTVTMSVMFGFGLAAKFDVEFDTDELLLDESDELDEI